MTDNNLQCPDCGGQNVHPIDGIRGARVECGDGGCGASWKPDAAWLDALFAEPERLLATLPQWARQQTDAEIVHTAPEVVRDARGFFWRRHYDGSLSILPTSTDNDPTAYPLVCYQPVDVERTPENAERKGRSER